MNPITAALVLILIHNVENSLQEKTSFRHQRDNHQPLELRDYEVKHLSEKLSNLNHLKATAEKILVPRVVGTEGHDNVRDFIIESMSSLGWDVISDKFQDNAPILGELTFENVIATLNPNADRYLLLACHYDSKYFPDEEFIGATDSAVPCAMMINLAYVLQDELNRAKNNTELSLMFVFFDGEEAFDEWGPNDSLYGARHLAQKWKKEKFLERIDLFVLLDLIGAPDPKFYNFFENTDRWFVRLSRAEKRLAKKKLLKNYAKTTITSKSSNAYFQNLSVRTQIEDDHIPFLRAGVPILHLIPMPFPDVWHTPKDDHSIIEYTTVENINRILRIFLVEYLNISPSEISNNQRQDLR